MGEQVGTSIGDSMMKSMEEAFMGGAPFGESPFGGYPGSSGPVEQSEPVPPGDLGPDPVLNQYAQNCFDGDLQACDDLYYESAPLSEYERYGMTCGGRVKPFTVAVCTDLGD